MHTIFKIAAAAITTMITFSAMAEEPLLPGEINCLARNVFSEARGESIKGQRWVMEVTLNRVADPRWPNTVCEVVYQSKQFSWTADVDAEDRKVYFSENLEYRLIRDRVKEWLNDSRIDARINHYARTEIERPWMEVMTEVAVIGAHKFFEY